MSKVPESERDAFISWQADFEYDKLGLPRPDMVIYLDVEPSVSQKLMEKRYGGDNSKKDLHCFPAATAHCMPPRNAAGN